MQLVKNRRQHDTQLHLKINGSLLFMDYIFFKESYNLEPNIKSIIVDFSELTEIDCSGLAMILLLQDYANSHNITLTVINSLYEKVSNLIAIANIPSKVHLVNAEHPSAMELVS